MLRSALTPLAVLAAVACGSSDRISITEVGTGPAFEGQPDVVVFVRGSGLSPDAAVSVVVLDDRLVAYRAELDVSPEFTVSSDGKWLAFVLPVPSMPELPARDTAAFELTIVQEDDDGEFKTRISGFEIAGLAELSIMAPLSPIEFDTDQLEERYSFIRLSGPVRLVGTKSAVFRSMGDLNTGDFAILDASGGSGASAGPGLCAELGFASSVATGTEPGPGGCAGGDPGQGPECVDTGTALTSVESLVPLAAFGGGGGAGGVSGTGGNGGGGGGVLGLDGYRVRVPGGLQISVDGSSGCAASAGDDRGQAGSGGALWIRMRNDQMFGDRHGFSALAGFSDRDEFTGPGLPGGYRVDRPRLLEPGESARFLSAQRGLDGHPLAGAPAGVAATAFGASLYQGPVLAHDHGVLTDALVNVVVPPEQPYTLVINGESSQRIGAGAESIDVDLDDGPNEVCIAVSGAQPDADIAAGECRTLVYLR